MVMEVGNVLAKASHGALFLFASIVGVHRGLSARSKLPFGRGVERHSQLCLALIEHCRIPAQTLRIEIV